MSLEIIETTRASSERATFSLPCETEMRDRLDLLRGFATATDSSKIIHSTQRLGIRQHFEPTW